MITFCKSVNCPTSQELLSFQNKETAVKEADAIEAHLNLCEFCVAEVEFYANYPQAEEPCVTVEIPIPLYQLAEALLNNNQKHFFSLNKLLSEKEDFPLEKA